MMPMPPTSRLTEATPASRLLKIACVAARVATISEKLRSMNGSSSDADTRIALFITVDDVFLARSRGSRRREP